MTEEDTLPAGMRDAREAVHPGSIRESRRIDNEDSL